MESSDFEFEELEPVEPRLALTTGRRSFVLGDPNRSLSLGTGSELVPYRQDVSLVPSSTELPETPDTPTTSPLPLALPAPNLMQPNDNLNNMLVPLQHSPTSPRKSYCNKFLDFKLLNLKTNF